MRWQFHEGMRQGLKIHGEGKGRGGDVNISRRF